MSRGHRNRGGLIPGLIMIAVGTAFLLERFDLLSTGRVWDYWPMILVVIGLGNVLRPEGGRRSIFLLLMGVWLQINVLGLWGMDWGDSWPLLIIFFGASFIFDSLVSSAGYGGGGSRRGAETPASSASSLGAEAAVADPSAGSTDTEQESGNES